MRVIGLQPFLLVVALQSHGHVCNFVALHLSICSWIKLLCLLLKWLELNGDRSAREGIKQSSFSLLLGHVSGHQLSVHTFLIYFIPVLQPVLLTCKPGIEGESLLWTTISELEDVVAQLLCSSSMVCISRSISCCSLSISRE